MGGSRRKRLPARSAAPTDPTDPAGKADPAAKNGGAARRATSARGRSAGGSALPTGEAGHEAGPRKPGTLVAADIMVTEVITLELDTPVERIAELFQLHNINGAPVVDGDGYLAGIVTEDDLIFGQMGLSDDELKARLEGAPAADAVRRADEIMTPMPFAAEEHTPIEELCRLMWSVKIHRVPIVSEGRVTGIVSTIDICRLVAEGKAALVPPPDDRA